MLTGTLVIGILAGLLCALSQSSCYLLSRRYVVRQAHSSWELFALCHVWMGGMAAAALPLLASPAAPRLAELAPPIVCACLSYLLGQVSLFTALRWTDASRVAPLLGLKILLLAAVATAGSHWPGLRRALPLDPITSWQWLAVVASVLAAFVLNRAGGRMAAAGFACILFTCLTYSLSDVSIGILVERVRPMGRLRGPMYGCCLSYLLTGAVGLAALAWRPVPAASKWWLAFPVAVSWLLGMLFLYVSFRLIGVLFGNIMQSTRGLISIGLGALVAGRSMHHLEARVDPGVFWRRVGAAVLMLAAVTVFLLGRTP